MPSFLVIRLHPVEPVSAEEFTEYLDGLEIAAYKLSFNDPYGSEPDSAEIGTAAHISYPLPVARSTISG